MRDRTNIDTFHPSNPRLIVYFYKALGGGQPVREWLLSLSVLDRRAIGTDIKLVQFAWPIGMPLVRSLGYELFEIRTSLQDRAARVIFYLDGAKMVLLHGFIKKQQKTAKEDLRISVARLRLYRKGGAR